MKLIILILVFIGLSTQAYGFNAEDPNVVPTSEISPTQLEARNKYDAGNGDGGTGVMDTNCHNCIHDRGQDTVKRIAEAEKAGGGKVGGDKGSN